jgi:uncharacterized protein (UPF0548 family)
MFLFGRPLPHAIEQFIQESRDLPLSYDSIGLVDRETAGFTFDTLAAVIGHGKADFDRAKTALMEWKQFQIGTVELFPHAASTEPGTVVAVLVRHLGFWSLIACRVVDVAPACDDARFGLAYGTLTNHAECGEERFEVFMDSLSNDVMYRVSAASRPRAMLAWLAYPYTRELQARFRRDSAEAMRRITNATRPARRPAADADDG